MTDTQLLGTAAAHSGRGLRGRGGGPGLSWGKADPTAAGCGQKPGGCCEAFPQPPRSGHTKCRLRAARDKGDPGRLEGGPGPAQGWGLRTEDSQGQRRSRAPGRKTRACPGLREGDPPGPAAVPARSPSLWAWHLLLICPRPHTPGNQTLPFLWDRRRRRGGGALLPLPLLSPTVPHSPPYANTGSGAEAPRMCPGWVCGPRARCPPSQPRASQRVMQASVRHLQAPGGFDLLC